MENTSVVDLSSQKDTNSHVCNGNGDLISSPQISSHVGEEGN